MRKGMCRRRRIALYLAVILTAALLATAVGAISVSANDGYTLYEYQTFEDVSDLTAAYSKLGKGGVPHGIYETDASRFADEPVYEKVYKVAAPVGVLPAGAPGIRYDFAAGTLKNADTETYFEFEYDLGYFPTAVSGLNVVLELGGAKIELEPTGSLRAKLFDGQQVESSNTILLREALNAMHRYKLTIHHDEDGYWYMPSFLFDGNEVLPAGKRIRLTSSATAAMGDFVAFRFSNPNSIEKTQNNLFYLDNLSFSSYTSASGVVSVTPDRYGLLKKIQAICTAADEALEAGSINQSIFAQIGEQVSGALGVLKSADSDRAAVASAAGGLDQMDAMLAAYRMMKESGLVVYSDTDSAYADTDSLSGAERVSVCVPIYTSEFEGSKTVRGVAALYRKNDDLFSGELLAVETAEKTIEPNQTDLLKFTLDLSAYPDKDTIFIKVLTVDRYSDIAASIPHSKQLFGGEQTPVDASYSFPQSVNVTKTLLNNNPNTEDYKVVCTLLGTAGESVSLLAMKDGRTADDLNTAMDAAVDYYDTAVFDENGKAVFEYVPQSGMGYYNYVITYGDAAPQYSGKLFYASLSDVNTILGKLCSAETLSLLTAQELDALSLSGEIYRNAMTGGVDMDGVLKETLAEKTYSAAILNEFTESILSKMNMVYAFRKAGTVDALMDLVETYGTKIEESGVLSDGLTSKQRQKAYELLCGKTTEIVDMKSLNSCIKASAETAKLTADNGTGAVVPPSGGGTGIGGGSAFGGGLASGGGWSTNQPSSENPAQEQGTVMQRAEAVFGDIDDVSWAKEGILMFAVNHWISGKEEGRFAPHDSVTREEFVKIAVNVFGLYRENAACGFADTAAGDWYYPYVASAVENGIIHGISENRFGVGETISRQDMAVIIGRIIERLKIDLIQDGEYLPFADEEFISDYARDTVIALAKNGILNGTDDNSFLPQGSATRAEAVKMLYEAYSLWQGE